MLRIAEHWHGSDLGRQRQGNEDNYYVRSPVFVVADGMGGAQAGEVASEMAVAAFDKGLPDGEPPAEGLVTIIETANRNIHDGITLGRAASSDVTVDDPFASAAHARIFPRGDFMYIEDMGSTNGIKVNGRRVSGPQSLKPGDVIELGTSRVTFELE